MSDALLSHDDDVKSALLRTNEAFRQLVLEHHDLDEYIRHLSSSPHLSDQQRFDEIALKKRKLALKDRIEALVHHYSAGAAVGRLH